MSKTPMKEFVYEGYLFYPWQGQVRFSVSLVDGKLVFKEGNKENDQYFENARAVTCRNYSVKEHDKFKSVEDDIFAHLQWGKEQEGHLRGEKINNSKEAVWVKIVRVYKN